MAASTAEYVTVGSICQVYIANRQSRRYVYSQYCYIDLPYVSCAIIS